MLQYINKMLHTGDVSYTSCWVVIAACENGFTFGGDW